MPRPTSPLVKSLSVTGAVALAVGLSATSGQAVPGPPAPPAPTTSAQAMTQLRAFNEQFEKVTEQYNDARILLARRTAESRVAARRAKAVAQTASTYRSQVRRLVRSESRSDPFGTFGAMLSSESPGDFAAQASIIDVVASRRAAVLTEAAKASAAAAKADSDARAATAAAAKLTRELAAKRSDLSRRAAQSKALFERLSAAERRAFLATQPHVQTRASRTETRPQTQTQSPPVSAAPVSVPASGRAGVAVAAARSRLGSPYGWGASGPYSFDCSGLTMYAWGRAGVALPHSSGMQMGSGPRVSLSALQPGDLVFYGSPVHHVALYAGGGQIIHAPQAGDVVRYASVYMMSPVGAVRPG
ncbi:MAG: C40 family peptidase [Mycobacteriales bacterium]